MVVVAQKEGPKAIVWVKGHTGVLGNMMADFRARTEAIFGRLANRPQIAPQPAWIKHSGLIVLQRRYGTGTGKHWEVTLNWSQTKAPWGSGCIHDREIPGQHMWLWWTSEYGALAAVQGTGREEANDEAGWGRPRLVWEGNGIFVGELGSRDGLRKSST